MKITEGLNAVSAFVQSALPTGWKLVDDISFSGDDRVAALSIVTGSLDANAIEADLVLEFRAMFSDDIYSAANQVLFALDPVQSTLYEEDEPGDGEGEGEGEEEESKSYVKLLKTGAQAKIFFNTRQLRVEEGDGE